MYTLTLTRSDFPAQTDGTIRVITVGGLLREIAAENPDAEAVVEVDQEGRPARRWTYGAPLEDISAAAGPAPAADRGVDPQRR